MVQGKNWTLHRKVRQKEIAEEPSRLDEKEGLIGKQDLRREKTEDHILWTDPPGRRIRTVTELSNTPSTGHYNVKKASSIHTTVIATSTSQERT